jgi:hypothetical protein
MAVDYGTSRPCLLARSCFLFIVATFLWDEHLGGLGSDRLCLFDHAHSAARLASTGTVAFFAHRLLKVHELQGDLIAELGESGAAAR